MKKNLYREILTFNFKLQENLNFKLQANLSEHLQV